MDGTTTTISSINGTESMRLAFQIGAQAVGGRPDLADFESIASGSGSNPHASEIDTSHPSSEIDLFA